MRRLPLIFCLLTAQWLLAACQQLIQVQQEPKDLILPPGSSLNISCFITNTNSLYLYWYRWTPAEEFRLVFNSVGPGSMIPEFEGRFKSHRPEQHKMVLESDGVGEDDSAVWYCAASPRDYEAYFGGGTKLTVLEKGRSAESPKVEILNVSSTEVCNKEAVTLVCLASKFYPDHVSVSWDMNGEEMGNVATDNAATRDDKYYSISSRLQIPYQTWTTGKTFTCTVKFFNGTGYENHPASIRGPVDSGRNEAATFVKSGKTTMLAYGMIIVKSVIYGIFIIVVIKKQDFRGK